ncbi:hybrid sensor histidine kinase/response regulator [Opitutus sp. ER46]|uniref:hybrid sensor histidine kinase/response regulator n=1 Tax=Opitutus sp. ER46 TaxID=2161864 RepID=UPI000D2F8A0D|nr:hybrid sensor histidine kinase/response regulator [Opitutus sp. ER46]PTY00114.1 hybrid sensor histidine kinase/response regulator [Opitutus sp. ER46]
MTPPRQSILVVDDTPANLQLLDGMLKECGYRVRPVTNGAHALRAVRTEPPDLVLLDVTMPEMNGYDVCRQLKADPATADIPVLFISALSETEDKLRAFEAGGVDYVSKPFQFAEVAARVKTHLQLRRQQRELQESLLRERNLERLRDQLTHLIVHDMRSPLLALKLTMDVLQPSAPPEDAELVAGAKAEIEGLVEMVAQLLDVAKMESGTLQPLLTPVNLPELAQSVLAGLKPLVRETEVRFEAPATLTVQADRELIRRVLLNLMTNALKLARRGHVAIRLIPTEGGARIEVQDDGPGIAPELHTVIFEKFGQVEREHAKYGTALGLAFAKMAVEAHYGTIGVTSAEGQGSTFWFTLPANAAPAQ